MPQLLPWIVALAAASALLASVVVMLWRRRVPQPAPLPAEWTLAPRPVFSGDERRVYRQLREALPHHIVLAKLPLVRFCQPTDPQETGYWYELLGALHVSFTVCSANGRVLAAIDLDTDRSASRRALQIKQSVLGACRVRYLRCPVDHLPSIPELQLLVPHSVAGSRGPQPAPLSPPGPEPLAAAAPAVRRKERAAALWRDSGFFQDSFFAPDNRLDGSEFGMLSGLRPGRGAEAAGPADERSAEAAPVAARYGGAARG